MNTVLAVDPPMSIAGLGIDVEQKVVRCSRARRSKVSSNAQYHRFPDKEVCTPRLVKVIGVRMAEQPCYQSWGYESSTR